uniref:CASP-like protein 2BC1 n=1 Tax=Picea sitchensis TaxID=3332 RepID=CSPL4_PICSI|nr:RecName: Full=CASP-like protein 2BC1; Short=PsCASPL2BC1 [Picea sitchensis]ADE75815.1 unknown [Picea sitchensis]
MRKHIDIVFSRLSGPILNPPPDNNVIPKTDRKLRITEVILRFAVVIFALVSAIMVGTASGTRDLGGGIRIHAHFTLLKTLPFLVIVDGILAVYSLLQGLRCFLSLYMRHILLNKALAWTIFCCDQALAYVIFAAAASTAETAYISEQGLDELQWIKVCMFFRAYCFKSGAGMINAFLAALCMVFVSGMSVFHLFRLYGEKRAYGHIAEQVVISEEAAERRNSLNGI